ncbi:MAG: M24 family metallopeptidase [Endomicrobiia bacterium]
MVTEKISSIQKLLDNNNVLLVLNNNNLFYLTGKNYNGYCLAISKNSVKVLTSEMFYGQIKKIFNQNHIVIGENLVKQVLNLDIKNKLLLLDTDNIPVKDYKILRKHFNVVFSDIIINLRKIKSEEEIKNIKQALKITQKILKEVKEFIKVGVKEVEVKNFILKKFIENNVEPAFDPIVAFDSNTSYPHHIPTNKKFKKESIILIDIGCKYNGYCCDITRMYNLDKHPKIKELYFKLKFLQQNLISMCKKGTKVKDIDIFAKEYFRKIGLEKNYLHSTGHGIGIEVHESPRISSKDESILKEGMVVTIEPGIYFNNKFGLRIEDDILCKENYYEILSSYIV